MNFLALQVKNTLQVLYKYCNQKFSSQIELVLRTVLARHGWRHTELCVFVVDAKFAKHNYTCYFLQNDSFATKRGGTRYLTWV